MWSNVARKMRMLATLATSNAHTRAPLPGAAFVLAPDSVAAARHAAAAGIIGTDAVDNVVAGMD